MERLIQHIDTQNLDALSNNDIAREYLAFKEQQLQGTKRFVENSAFLSVLGGLAVIDGGLCLFTWFFFGDSIAKPCQKLGDDAQRARFKRTGQKKARLENFAGQMVEGPVEDVLTLMALQEVMLGFEWDTIFIQTENKNQAVRDHVEARMRDTAKNVEVPDYGVYKILKSRDDVRRFNLDETVKTARNPQKKLLKRMMRRKP